MKVWLIQRSEPTPHDNAGSQRAMRMGILAQMLARTGHRVLWWTSTFDHNNRRHRHKSNVRLDVEPGYEIQYLRGCGYARNISVSRAIDNVLVARQFSALAKKDLDPPDVILASIPTAELGLSAVEYANKHCIPIFLDIRDLWPDVFFDLVPAALKPVVQLFTMPMKRKLKSACTGADGIIGLTDSFVNWGLAYAGRLRTDTDRVFPAGYLSDNISVTRIEDGRAFWDRIGVSRVNDELIAVFIGTLGKGFNFDPVIQAVHILEQRHIPIKVIICGAGENAETIKKQAEGLTSFVFPGWVNAEQIKALLNLADIGIAPYIERNDFANSSPNKAAEYLSGGLPIALSLDNGELYRLVTQRRCGFSYNSQSEKLANDLEFLAKNPRQLETLKIEALATYNELFNGTLVYTRLINFLEEMVQNKKYGK